MKAPGTAQPQMQPFLPATADFVSGKDSPRAFLERCIAELYNWEPKIGAFVTLNLAAARTAADPATERWRAGKPLSPIDGMPIGIKDIIETIDMPTENGSPLFAGFRSERDSASVAALREAGAVILGKTVTTEFAWMQPRATRNPWDLTRTPGGSSSGSAAAVAVGAISVGIGTQVFGSIVRPASFCGCFGFKPTVGAINRGGSHDALSQSTHGPIAASLPEAWQVAYEISRRAGGDPGFPGLYGPSTCPAPVEAAPTCRSGNRRLGGGDISGEGGASRKRRRNSNQPASRSYRGMKMKRSPRSRTRSTTRGSSPTTSSPGSRAGRSTPIARATRANSASRCSTLRRGPRR